MKEYSVATISQVIADLQAIKEKFGDTGTYAMGSDGDIVGIISVKPAFIDGREQAMIII